MLWLTVTILAVIVLVMLRQQLRLRRLLRELNAAVRNERRLLLQDSSVFLEKLGARELVDALNGLIDAHKETTAQTQGYSHQVEAMLGAVQEAVIVFNEDRIIQYANRSALDLFNEGKELKGQRLEAALRSLTLLELLDEGVRAEQTESSQIRIDQGDASLWFEASCGKVRGLEPEGDRLTLLVLHEITKLKALEVMRREFVANVSHELRTPLTIIKGFAETLIDDGSTIDAGSRRRFTEKILNNAERLHVLVEDLLTLSRLESRPDQIEPIEQPLVSLFEEVAESYRSRIDEREQRIEVEIDPAVGKLFFDRYRLHQVLDNLIENTFRYAPEFSCIRLEARKDAQANRVVCAVVDDGPGIPQKDLPHLFERFYRVDKGRSRETGGTGLGLSIVKHIILLHGGTVSAESKLGEGTRMIFSLPIQRPSSLTAKDGSLTTTMSD
jgi:signal transduction histidine kinase